MPITLHGGGLVTALTASTPDPSTLLWVAAVVTAGGTVAPQQQTDIDNLIKSAKSHGYFSKLDRLFPYAADTGIESLIDIIAQASSTATATFAANRGYTGDGFSTDTNSQFNPTTAPSPKYTQDSACLFGWSNTAGQDAGGLFGLNVSGDPCSRLFPLWTDGNTYWDLNDNASGHGIGATQSGGTGLYLLNRTSSTVATVDYNGSQVDTASLTSQALTNDTIRGLHAFGGNNFSQRQLSCLGFGAGLTASDRVNIYNDLRTYMTARGVP